MYPQKSHLAIFLAASLAAGGLSQAAMTIYSTDFPGAENSQPANWTVLAGGTGSSITNGWYIDSGGDYRYKNSDTGVSGLSHYTGTLSNGTQFDQLTDFTITADFRRSATSVVGLAGRISSSNTFYHARLLDTGNFQLYKFVGGSATQLGSTATISESYTDNSLWSMSMTFEGDSITAKIFNTTGDEVASITQTDSSIAMGSAGIRSQNSGRYATYEISVVPEPSSALLITSGLAGLLLRRKR